MPQPRLPTPSLSHISFSPLTSHPHPHPHLRHAPTTTTTTTTTPVRLSLSSLPSSCPLSTPHGSCLKHWPWPSASAQPPPQPSWKLAEPGALHLALSCPTPLLSLRAAALPNQPLSAACCRLHHDTTHHPPRPSPGPHTLAIYSPPSRPPLAALSPFHHSPSPCHPPLHDVVPNGIPRHSLPPPPTNHPIQTTPSGPVITDKPSESPPEPAAHALPCMSTCPSPSPWPITPRSTALGYFAASSSIRRHSAPYAAYAAALLSTRPAVLHPLLAPAPGLSSPIHIGQSEARVSAPLSAM